MNSTNTLPTPSGDDLAGFSWFNGLTDGERSLWLGLAGSARPADAWGAYKRVGRVCLRPSGPSGPCGPLDARLSWRPSA